MWREPQFRSMRRVVSTVGTIARARVLRSRKPSRTRSTPADSQRRAAEAGRHRGTLGEAKSPQGDGPSTIDLTHEAEYGAPRLLAWPIAINCCAISLSDLRCPLGERRCRRLAARTNFGSRSA